jgi:hypothetical protein
MSTGSTGVEEDREELGEGADPMGDVAKEVDEVLFVGRAIGHCSAV